MSPLPLPYSFILNVNTLEPHCAALVKLDGKTYSQ